MGKAVSAGLAVAAVGVVLAVIQTKNPSFRIFPENDVPGLLTVLNADHALAEGVADDISKYSNAQDTADDEVQAMVNRYYNLATDFYEYGWGESFHFAHTKAGESHEASILRHEMRIIDELGIQEGHKVLDAGCGVGGPARAIAKASKAKVTGVTLNAYQVQRARYHTKNAGLTDLVNFVQGDYTKLTFEDASFDRAYAIESTCHSPDLTAAYSEIYRVLKPGGKFLAYEWIKASGYNGSAEHDAILREIEYGSGLPPMNSRDTALKAVAAAGFKVVIDNDLAQDTDNTTPWWNRLDISKMSYYMTHASVYVLETLRWAPRGTVLTHSMLLRAAWGLVDGGKSNCFTPMHLFVMEKPLE
eukprot:m.440223 g.440223  ORF g.440223 m.440223 type:complete len:359 (+) comp18486_c0_seq1:45-1121(+)